MDIKDFRALTADAQETLRRRAVNAIRSGLPPGQAAVLFGVSRQAITKWMRLFKQDGETALLAKKRGAPRKSKRNVGASINEL